MVDVEASFSMEVHHVALGVGYFKKGRVVRPHNDGHFAASAGS